MAPENSAITIETVSEVSTELFDALVKLVPQLSSGWSRSEREIDAIISRDPMTLFIARLRGEIVGTLTLLVVDLLTGRRGHIEDVVVDESARGAGIGGALVAAALEQAAQIGVRSVDLTSRPTREAANRLYERYGFTQRETNVWRWQPPKD